MISWVGEPERKSTDEEARKKFTSIGEKTIATDTVFGRMDRKRSGRMIIRPDYINAINPYIDTPPVKFLPACAGAGSPQFWR